MVKPDHPGFEHFKHSTRYSIKGLRAAFQHEAAFRQELGVIVLLLPLSIWLARHPVEVVLLMGSCLLVLIVELINSAIESVVDRIGDEPHELSGRAKDMGSAAVMLTLILAGAVWAVLVWQRFWG